MSKSLDVLSIVKKLAKEQDRIMNYRSPNFNTAFPTDLDIDISLGVNNLHFIQMTLINYIGHRKEIEQEIDKRTNCMHSIVQ